MFLLCSTGCSRFKSALIQKVNRNIKVSCCNISFTEILYGQQQTKEEKI